MTFRAIFLHCIEPLVKSDLPSDKTVLIFIGLLSPRGSHISASQTEKNLSLSGCMSALFFFSRIAEDLESGYTVRKGEVSRQTSAQCFLDHLLRLWTYLSGGFSKKYHNATVLSKCHWFHVPHFFQQLQIPLQMFVKSRNQCSTICSQDARHADARATTFLALKQVRGRHLIHISHRVIEYKMQTHPDEHFEHSWQHSFVQLKSRCPLRVLLPIRMTWGIPKELWIQKRPTIIALQYSTYSLLFFMTGKHWDQSKELSKNCSSNFKWLGVIWGLDWLRQICSHCSWFEHELAVLIILFINLGERVSEWVRARSGLRRSSGSVRVSTCECWAAEISLQESLYPLCISSYRWCRNNRAGVPRQRGWGLTLHVTLSVLRCSHIACCQKRNSNENTRARAGSLWCASTNVKYLAFTVGYKSVRSHWKYALFYLNLDVKSFRILKCF